MATQFLCSSFFYRLFLGNPGVFLLWNSERYWGQIVGWNYLMLKSDVIQTLPGAHRKPSGRKHLGKKVSGAFQKLRLPSESGWVKSSVDLDSSSRAIVLFFVTWLQAQVLKPKVEWLVSGKWLETSQKKSKIWRHFERLKDNPNKVKYKLCIAYHSTTSNMTN